MKLQMNLAEFFNLYGYLLNDDLKMLIKWEHDCLLDVNETMEVADPSGKVTIEIAKEAV